MFGVHDVVVKVYICPPVCLPFLLFMQALLGVISEFPHECDGIQDPIIKVVVEGLEIGVCRELGCGWVFRRVIGCGIR